MDGRTEGRNAENYVPPLFFEKAGDNKCTYKNIVEYKRTVAMRRFFKNHNIFYSLNFL